MAHAEPIAILSCARTPIGDFLGQLSSLPAPQLGAYAIQAALESAQISPNQVDEVIMGCVLSAGLGQAPARQAALLAGLPHSVGATTINKMCGSGMKAIMLAMDSLRSGNSNIVIAGGMESMSNAPYLLPALRQGYRMGHQKTVDHMLLDGLEDAYEKGALMGVFAEKCADYYAFTREQQDQFALDSLRKAQAAQQAGYFNAEIVPIEVTLRKEILTISADELPLKAKPEKIPTLKPVFKKDGTVTAANASAISDGAAALVLMRLSDAQQMQLPIQGILHEHATFAQDPAWFTTAPVGAIKKVLEKTEWHVSHIDLFEINEAFAVVTLAAMEALDLGAEKVNVYGGACALGHPIGASGARIVVTLLNALANTDQTTGVASLCIGGGEGTALSLERI